MRRPLAELVDPVLPRQDLPLGLLLGLPEERPGVDSTVVATVNLDIPLLPATVNLSRATALTQAMARDTANPPTRARVRPQHRDMANNTVVDMVHLLLTPTSLDMDSPLERHEATPPTRHPSRPGTDRPRSLILRDGIARQGRKCEISSYS